MRKHESTLLELLRSGAAEGAAEGLAHMGPSRSSLSAIVDVLSTSDTPRVREWLLIALGKLGKDAKSAVPLVRRLLREALDSLEEQAARDTVRKLAG